MQQIPTTSYQSVILPLKCILKQFYHSPSTHPPSPHPIIPHKRLRNVTNAIAIRMWRVLYSPVIFWHRMHLIVMPQKNSATYRKSKATKCR